jgi:hypothetical protein
MLTGTDFQPRTTKKNKKFFQHQTQKSLKKNMKKKKIHHTQTNNKQKIKNYQTKKTRTGTGFRLRIRRYPKFFSI